MVFSESTLIFGGEKEGDTTSKFRWLRSDFSGAKEWFFSSEFGRVQQQVRKVLLQIEGRRRLAAGISVCD